MMKTVPVAMRTLSCEEIYTELEILAEHDSELETKIHLNRSKNQTAGYIGGVLFLPALLATENDGSTKSLLDRNQKVRDQLILVQKVKRCPLTH